MNLEPSDETTRSDTQLLQRAIRRGWNLPPEISDTLPQRLEELTRHKDARIAIRASQTLLDMNEQNGPTDDIGPQVKLILYDADVGPPPVPTGEAESVRICIPDNGRD